MKTIEINVLSNGQACIETLGFSGAECRQASEHLEQMLGNRLSEQLKPEFHSNTLQAAQEATNNS